ncbi:glycosyl transferase family 90 domain-containing protein [Hirsutella rhossiliensis]|uniref:Glycosyl transferase family 90 domain-containing protein n=1 Tax=Hirsutella rhossiliensis TaxID=111463 RepID=A0A9P8N2C6_9HYPO|nr:glycosyl transferase family 90 domain-containing protein [Hirsutella rhossiliensis]KAH0964661.1 glycosyl transferase family 90 domain-containing protein [Hirsutella rhossiliensis]
MVKKMLSPGPFPRRPSGFVRYLVVSVLLLVAFFSLHRSSRDIYVSSAILRRPLHDTSLNPGLAFEKIASKPHRPMLKHQPSADEPKAPLPVNPDQHHHPIDKLIYDAQHSFAELMSKESKTVEQAAEAYRKRRGRHPPPGFDKWHEFARSHNVVLVEDFFDQIHHDIEPFWGMEPLDMRRRASQAEMTINIRKGNASAASDWFWTKIWLEMIKEIEHGLPDMDIALNAMDEPRLVVPWEDINGYMEKAAKTTLPAPQTDELGVKVPKIEWEGTKPYWSVARRGCSPDSPAREAPLQESFADPPVICNKYAAQHLHEGYVANYTKSNELCHQPDLQGLEGILIEPISTSATKIMFPMFGGSKLTVNNEILLPAPMYWSEEERFTGGGARGARWADKNNTIVWRGVATGGKNRETNWRGFQRHRFVSMGNGTKIGLVESGKARAENFVLPSDEYHVNPAQHGKLGEWDGGCNYTDFYFEPQSAVKMAEQFNSKFLPDIDGNSFSGRYLGFLRSTSLPIKATVWREWHDSRLVPWKHFVPMDNRFSDYYGIMEYFLGYKGRNDHDAAAEKIATEGKEWAERVLRKEDMLVYVMRLLLEYARVLDDRRETMGWVADLLKDSSLKESR